jgi:methionyl-tRNA synthetase
VTLEGLKQWGKEKSTKKIGKSPALFPRIESPDTRKEKSPAGWAKKTPTPPSEKKGSPPPKPQISFEEFQKMDLRVGTIKAAEGIPDSKKLIRLTVDTGDERTVVAGIKGHYRDEDLVGMQVLVVTNLKPVTLMGVKSQGMILAASDASGLHLLIPDSRTTSGSEVR